MKIGRYLVLVALASAGNVLAADAAPSKARVEPHAVYMQPVENFTALQKEKFQAGEKAFMTSWVVFPQLNIPNWDYMRPQPMMEWGLGPTFLANSCAACHVQAGRGRTTEAANTPFFQQLLRLSIPGTGPHGGPKPHPHYGLQLQVFDVLAHDETHTRQGEADVFVDWITETTQLPDGMRIELRRPDIRIANLNFGSLGPEVMTSLRNSRVIFGLGYLEAVSDSDIRALAAIQHSYGIHGRINYVRDDINDKQAIGRFGWKANQPSIRQQIAAAFLGDMGVTSSLYPLQNCPPTQTSCKKMLPGDKVELREEMLSDLVFWVTSLEAPEPRDSTHINLLQGKKLFEQAQCAACHLPELRTGEHPELPQLSKQKFHAYTDMLIHDMDPSLADGRPDFNAGPADWLTPPLWGIGLSKQVNGSTNLLHDGRARNVLEAILWHGGEAAQSRDLFANFSKEERAAVIAFINSL